MKPKTLIVTTGLLMTCAALAAPADAQPARFTIGAVFGTGPQYPPTATYPGRPGPGGYGNYRGFGARDYALNRGYNDGYEQGFEAARDRDRFDPRRERWYRDAQRGYDRDFRMSRNEYRDVYRRGFMNGYETGYRDAQWGGRGNYSDRDRRDWRR
ncbi:MAG TPA: hypothetical protein VLN08_01295 [Vicinamibacterales bacterium]|nr:hypothetical protein [Vicinamibacterales bacterium]